MSLNKIIYSLFVLLLLQLSIFAIYIIVNTFLAKEERSKESLSPNPLLSSSEGHKSSSTEITQERMKSLDELIVHVAPDTKFDIVSIENKSVKPIIYTKSIEFSKLTIENKKKMFINMLIPAILVVKYRISEERKEVSRLLKLNKLSKKEELWLTKKRHIFKASTIDDLYNKMELHPTSIVIAQAIIESGWGTSRFFEKANNVFGIWSFNKYEQRIAASEKRGTKTIYLKKYKSVEQSITDYFLMLSTKHAYRDFREKRLKSQDPFVLIKELGRYSELGDEYIENLKNTIEKNQLLAYDTYALDL